MTQANVLVTAVGGIVGEGIMKCLRLGNRSGGVSYRVFTADASPQAAGLYRGDAAQLVPPVGAPEYLDAIVRVCNERMVRAVFVGSDEELLTLANAQERIRKESGALVICNPISVISTCMDKWKTYQFLKRNNFECPESALPEDEEAFIKEFGFPVVVKPRDGHGSEQFYLARSREDVQFAMSAIRERGWSPFLQEYLAQGDSEFTSGVTVDAEGKQVMSSISMRRTLKGGQTYKAFIDDYGEVRRSAERIALSLGARGPINVQARMAGDQIKPFEINPRFSASCPIRAAAGVNEPDLTFRSFCLGEHPPVVTSYQRLVCLRFWDELYVPIGVYEDLAKTGRVDGRPDSTVHSYF